MELKQLAYFKAVADEGTISGAARKLNMSQPPLSSQMHFLEQELGCVLFERGSRKIRLTEAGRMFYERACAMLTNTNCSIQEVSNSVGFEDPFYFSRAFKEIKGVSPRQYANAMRGK